MKKYFVIAFVLLSTITLSSNELSWVDAQVEAIKPPRKGISSASISNVASPFIFLNKTKKASTVKSSNKASKLSGSNVLTSPKSPKSFVLGAIINSSAMINGKWYKLDSKVHGYKLSKVDRMSVVLTKGKKKLVLSTNSTTRNLKFK